jgi:hypothetical protein
MRRMRLREVNQLLKSHIVSEWQNQDLSHKPGELLQDGVLGFNIAL